MKTKNWLVGSFGCLGLLAQTIGVCAEAIPSEMAKPSAVELEMPVFSVAVDPKDDPAKHRIGSENIALPLPIEAPLEIETMPDFSMPEEPMAQVRSVTEFSDVYPNDWAYQALRSLVERYGVLAGDSTSKFRGNQPLTRNEFAAALVKVLDKLDERLAAEQRQLTQLREDFATVRRLQETYGAIATDLDKRLTSLDTQITTLTAQNFSPTTKLAGQTILALTDGSSARSTILFRTRLDLRTSFSGTDLLLTQLEAGSNNGGDATSLAQNSSTNLLGTTGLLADGGGLDYVGLGSNLRLSKLYYTFQPHPSLNLTLGTSLTPRDFIDYNHFANDSAKNFSSSFFANNPLIVQNPIDRVGGAGVALAWKPSSTLPLTVRSLYVAADAERPNPGQTQGGLFGDRYQGSVELEYAFNRDLAVRLQYTRAKVNGVDISAFGLNAEWAVNTQYAVFVRYGFGSYDGFNPFLGRSLDLNPHTWAIGATVRNIVIPGSTAGVAIGQPFIEGDLGNATQTNFELYYSFLLNDNVSFTPALIVVDNANNQSRGTIWQWVIRMVYSF